jgi:hypothetical protein
LLDLLTRNLKSFKGFIELRDQLIARKNPSNSSS